MNENDKNLIVKYITGQATDEEIALVKFLINSSKAHEEFYVHYYETWQKSLRYDLSVIDTDKAYDSFRNSAVIWQPAPRRMFTMTRIAIAASMIIVCAFAAYFLVLQKSPAEVSLAAASNEIRVPKGTTKKTTLPDGTKVWINAGSTLRVEDGFEKDSRTVYLDGEAYFDIAKGELPFIVKTNRHTIRDIGTIFNIKAYSDDFEFETAVIEGEVSVEGTISGNSNRVETISVTKQQVLKLNYSPVETITREMKGATVMPPVAKVQLVSSPQLEAYTGWTEDILVFEGKTFQEISKIMERKYDVEIVMNDPKLRSYEYTGSFKNVDQIEKALKILKETTDINFSKNGRVITIWTNNNLTEDSL